MENVEITELNAVADLESVENMLDDLDLGDNETLELEAVEELIEDLVSEDDGAVLELSEEEVGDADLRDLEIQMEREEAYEEQASGVDADTESAKAVKAETQKPKRVKGTASKKAAGAPRVNRDLNSIPLEFFVLEGDASAMGESDLNDAKAATLALMPTQKKIAEKFDNLFTSLASGKQPSVYVVQAFKLLDEKKSISSKDIVASFKGSYSAGTAMSQAGQIMNLFATVQIASRSKSDLVLNENSVVAQRLRDVIAAAKAA